MLPDDGRQMIHVLVRRRFLCTSSRANAWHCAVAWCPASCSDLNDCHLAFELMLWSSVSRWMLNECVGWMDAGGAGDRVEAMVMDSRYVVGQLCSPGRVTLTQ